MKPPRLSNFFAAAALASTLAAQHGQITHETLTGWTHQGPGSVWLDDQVEPTAEFGLVDYLVVANDFSFDQVLALQTGSFVVRARIRKRAAAFGTEPIELRASLGGYSSSVTMPVADQPVDQWVNTPWLNFNVVATTGPVTISIGNFDPARMLFDYEFDSITIGRHTEGSAFMYESLDEFTFANDPAYNHEVGESNSAFGEVAHLTTATSVSITRTITLEPAGYWVRCRLLKMSGPNAASTDSFEVRLTPQNGATVTSTPLLASAQPLDVWVTTPWVYVGVTAPGTPVTIELASQTSATKADYLFDACHIAVSTQTRTVASGCASSSAGIPTLTIQNGQWAWTNNTLSLRLENGPPTQPTWFVIGFASASLDLTVIGMPGCQLATLPVVTTTATTDTGGMAPFLLGIPNDRNIVGQELFIQGLVLDPPANALGLITSDTRVMTVGS